jgi:hypothetical protein
VRTTLTIDDDLLNELKEVAHREGLPLKQLVNRALRRGLRALDESVAGKPYRCPTFSMGVAAPGTVDLDKALSIAAELEDEETARKLELRK